jgi:hypothetical protein
MHVILKLAVAGLAIATAGTASAERLFGLTFDNRIVTFDSANPEAILTSRIITGLADGEMLTGLDVRPATGTLYSMTTTGRLYELTVSGATYVANPTGMLTTSPSGNTFGFDFNPVPDRLRVVSDTGQNLRINVEGGATIVDGMITADFGPIALSAVAYTNSFAGAMQTTLYGIDTVTDRLVRSLNPNAGTYTNTNMMGDMFGPLGLSFTIQNAVGFDISPNTGIAYLNIDSLLWTVDLMTGRASSIGVVGAGPLRSIATEGFGAAVPEPATWAMLIAGFGLVGAAARRRRPTAVSA